MDVNDLSNIIAPIFSTSQTYNKGDYVLYKIVETNISNQTMVNYINVSKMLLGLVTL